ncbi:hypothetical protein IMSAGC007_02896 [Lachnospiraceae bacterium]|nr:hypothetical protein IMSAGC007_02896 [Lachnospiraceae bacterium]
MLIKYEVGDMFLSNADCLVNTVNCEGFMGKGVAYQFKMKFPENNKDYVEACKSGRLYIGTLHFYRENGVTIINFPTKDKWRAKSLMSYIETGLDQMVQLLPKLSVKTIAIPPLGCGNGGLNWQEVKQVIEEKLSPIQEDYVFIVYEPSKNFVQKAQQEPKLGVSSLVLMQMLMELKQFKALRLQKAAYFMNIFLKENYFKFQKGKNGPYADSIRIVSKSIREYQSFYGLKNLQEAYQKVYQVLCSDKTDKQLVKLRPVIEQAVTFVNEIEEDKELEGIATALFLIETSRGGLTEEQVIEQFIDWSEDKAARYAEEEIVSYVERLEDKRIIERNILGCYQLSEYR